MRIYLMSLMAILSLYITSCLTIGCADDRAKIIDMRETGCCASCDVSCEPKVIHDEVPPPIEIEEPYPDDGDNGDCEDCVPPAPNVTVIIDNNNNNDNDNENENTNTQCSKQYTFLSKTQFEMVKKCEKKPPCHGVGKWEKYNGHYILNYKQNACSDEMVEQIPCSGD